MNIRLILLSAVVVTSSCQEKELYMYYQTPQYNTAVFKDSSLPHRNSPVVKLTPEECENFRKIKEFHEKYDVPSPTFISPDHPDIGHYIICDKEGNRIPWGKNRYCDVDFRTFNGEKGDVMCWELDPFDMGDFGEASSLWRSLKPKLMPAFIRAWEVNPEVIQAEKQKRSKEGAKRKNAGGSGK